MRVWNGTEGTGACNKCGTRGPKCGNDGLCAKCDECPNCVCGKPTHNCTRPRTVKHCERCETCCTKSLTAAKTKLKPKAAYTGTLAEAVEAARAAEPIDSSERDASERAVLHWAEVGSQSYGFKRLDPARPEEFDWQGVLDHERCTSIVGPKGGANYMGLERLRDRYVTPEAKARKEERSGKQKEEEIVAAKTKARKEWDMAKEAIRTGEPTLILGPAGIGKTQLAYSYADEIGKRLYVSNITKELLAQVVFLGCMMPNEKGGMFWMDAPGARALREGCPYLINEADHAGPDVESGYYWVMDDPEKTRVTLPNPQLEELSAAPGYQVIATMNGEIDDLPLPIQSRLINKIKLTTLNPDAVKKLEPRLRAFANRGKSEGSKGEMPDLRALFGFQRVSGKVGDEKAAQFVFHHRATEFLNALKLSNTAPDTPEE